jgi:hypothetical protein
MVARWSINTHRPRGIVRTTTWKQLYLQGRFTRCESWYASLRCLSWLPKLEKPSLCFSSADSLSVINISFVSDSVLVTISALVINLCWNTAAVARPQSSSPGIGESVVIDVGIQLPWPEHKALLRAPASPVI